MTEILTVVYNKDTNFTLIDDTTDLPGLVNSLSVDKTSFFFTNSPQNALKWLTTFISEVGPAAQVLLTDPNQEPLDLDTVKADFNQTKELNLDLFLIWFNPEKQSHQIIAALVRLGQ